MSKDYLFCEPLIIERLRTETNGFIEISGAAGLANMTSTNNSAPAAYVVYQGDVINDQPSATGGHLARQQYVTQLWAIIVAVHYTEESGKDEVLSNPAGPFISQVINTLSGWQPRNRIRPFRRHSQHMPVKYDNGFGYFPLLFQVQIPASI
nr:hypothetical protein [uncultured Enterobacter sp.]